ncbi:cadherin repeat domain-containing protein, partial [Sulfuricurvum sp.]|uniref:cadherin repeat domain-containing protein n=1 Tax=Sulfuricurvum sp. TaxID=2025608 RepID=UPI002616978D
MSQVITLISRAKSNIIEQQTITTSSKVITIDAKSGMSYELKNLTNNVSPKKIIIKKVNNDLEINIDGDLSGDFDVIIKDYYTQQNVDIIGLAEDGNMYSYVTTSNDKLMHLNELTDNNVNYESALGISDIIGGISTLAYVAGGAALLSGIIAAAGSGGGKGDSGSGNIKAIDTIAPTITSTTTATTINENSGSSQVIYTATSTDSADITTGSTTYSLKTTADSNLFSINSSTGEVSLIGNPDYEAKSTYSFTLIATDSANNSSEQTVTLAIANLDEVAPTITSGGSANVDENTSASYVLYSATSTDSADISAGVTYSLSGADASFLSINTATGEVRLNTSADYETKSSYSFNVVADDGVNTPTTQAVVVSVSNLDEVAPTITSTTTATTINENSGSSQVIYTATSTDSADITTGSTTY